MDSFDFSQPHLSEEQRYILELTTKVQDTKHQLKEQELKVKLQDTEHQLKEQELEAKLQDTEHQLKIKQLEIAFSSEKQTLKDQLCTANLKILLRNKLLNVRSFIFYVKDEHLSNKSGSNESKFQTLAAEHPELLKKWKIEKKSFCDILQKLMKKLNADADPFFDCDENFVLDEADMQREELKLIGFIWSAVPLDEKKLYVRKLNKEIIHLVRFIEE
ncbi:unnamed protein product [Tenebrio molitor]|nr:unnamed protein product [Tenebrio molitor]